MRMPGGAAPPPALEECGGLCLGSALPPAPGRATLGSEPGRLQELQERRGAFSTFLLYFVLRAHFAITDQVGVEFSGCLLKY